MKKSCFVILHAVAVAVLCLAAPAQAADKTLRVAIPGFPSLGMNPLTSTNLPALYTFAAVYDALTWVDNKGKAMPQAAESWSAVDETTWRFKLYPGQVFSDGTPLNAEAVVFAVDLLRSPAGQSYTVMVEVPSLKSARAIDETTVEIKTSVPNPFLPQELSLMRLMSPSNWAKVGDAGINKSPIGSGPFVVETWTPGVMTLKPNPTALRKPKVDKLEIRAVPDTPARIQALLAERIDIAMALGPDEIPLLEAAGHKMVVQSEASMILVAFITVKDSPLKDVRVRRALNYAVNKQEIVDTLLAGKAAVASQTAPINSFGYDPSIPAYPYDPALAKKLLAEAGYANGFAMVAEIYAGNSSFAPLVYQKVSSDLAQVGVKLDVRMVPIPKYAQGLHQGTWDGTAIGIDYNSSPSLDPLRGFLRHSCLWKAPWYCDETIIPLLKQALGTFDLDKRRELTRQVLRHQRDQAPGILLHDYVRFDGVAKRVKNFSINIGYVPYADIEIAE
ncbi:MAG: ABC transporter substrate-binding protein [Rhodospirillaceae bacterium]|nr:ABC transporter substrate-binding protein [Rhodospirillaceae bacterium]